MSGLILFIWVCSVKKTSGGDRMNNGNPFFDHPILNSPYSYPERHWELDDQGQPTQKIIQNRRPAEFITPIPKPKKRMVKQSSWCLTRAWGCQRLVNSTTTLRSSILSATKLINGDDYPTPVTGA